MMKVKMKIERNEFIEKREKERMKEMKRDEIKIIEGIEMDILMKE